MVDSRRGMGVYCKSLSSRKGLKGQKSTLVLRLLKVGTADFH